MKTQGNMCTQPSPCEQAQATNQKATRDSYKGTKPLRMN